MTFTGHVYAAPTVPSGVQVTITNASGGPTAVTWPAATYESPAAALAALIAAMELAEPGIAPWTGSISTTTGLVTIDCPSDTWVLTWTSTDARDFLGFTANISSTTSAQTGTKNCLGLWIPDRPLNARGGYLAVPDVVHSRSTRSPQGLLLTHSSAGHYEHSDIRWANVDNNRVWVANETTANQSLQRFLRDTQWGQGHAWFTTSSKCMIVSHDASASELGNGTVAGWYLVISGKMHEIVSRSVEGWDGQWTVLIPEVISPTS